MAKSLIHCLKACNRDFIDEDSKKALSDRLSKGAQTQDKDHEFLAKLLNISIVIHHCPSGVTEIINEQPNPTRSVHMRFSQRLDGEGVSQGHFDLLCSSCADDCPADVSTVDSMFTVNTAITIRGADVAGALLQGAKDIENRPFSMQGGWVCIHVAKSDAFPHVKKAIQELIPGMDCSMFPKSTICGMVFVASSCSLPQYRASVGCGDKCSFPTDWKNGLPTHLESCKCSRHAYGPVLNFVKDRIIFNHPIEASGGLGRWSLSNKTAALVREVLKKGDYSRACNPDPPVEIVTEAQGRGGWVGGMPS